MLATTNADAIQGALNVVTDPCLRDVAGLLHRLHELEAAGAPDTPTQPTLGIGLCKAVPAIKALIYVRQNPWVAFLGAAAIVGTIVGVGYRWGKRSSGKGSTP